MTRVALLFCLSALCFYSTPVLGCSCDDESLILTNLQSACRDYQFARDVFTARVISRGRQCSPPDCSGLSLGLSGVHVYNYTIEVVNVFKGKHQVGDRFADNGPDTLTSCGDSSNILNVGTTYLVGIGGACSKVKEYSPYDSVSSDIIQAITDGCSSCPYVKVQFEHSEYTVNEDSKVIIPALVLSNRLSTDITVQVKSKDNTTIGQLDYISGPYNVTVSAGSTRTTFDIALVDDDIHEERETFMLTISRDSLPTCAFISNYIGRSGVTIVDNDYNSATVSFEFTNYTVPENVGKMHAVLVLSRPLSTTVRVRVNTRDGTAIGNGVDYDSGPYRVVFPAGLTKAQFDVLINDDNVSEPQENFRLIIKNRSLPSGITLGQNRRATVTIVEQ